MIEKKQQQKQRELGVKKYYRYTFTILKITALSKKMKKETKNYI
jgi:hypothetical protein